MALAEETPRVLHQGNDTRGPFSLSVGGTPITFADSSHIVVTRFSSAGVGTVQVEGSDYDLSATSVLPPVGTAYPQTVSAATLTFDAGEDVLATDEFVLIERVSPRTQQQVLTSGGDFSSAANERSYDAIVRQVQELSAIVARALRLNDLDTSDPVKLSETLTDLDGKLLSVDSGAIVGVDSSDFVGDTGAAGADGALWYAGAGAPSDGTGANGDMYLNLSNGDVYGPKASGTWGSAAGNIAGPAGAGTGDMLKTENLSGLASVSTARSNLGLGSAALLASSAVFQVANNLSEGTAATMRSNLGLGTAALLASSAVFQVSNNLSEGTPATMRTNLGLGSAALLAETTTAQYLANTADKALSTDQVWAAGAHVALTDGANIAVDMSTGINFSVTLEGNRTLSNPTNPKVGQCGVIVITQDGTGSRTLAYGSNWEFAGGSAPVLSTAPGAKDLLHYEVLSATSIFATVAKAVS